MFYYDAIILNRLSIFDGSILNSIYIIRIYTLLATN